MELRRSASRFANRARKRLVSFLDPQPDPYALDPSREEPSASAWNTAKRVRGLGRPPALMVYGVTPRCGTNFVANVMALHPAFAPWPNLVWEVPFLRSISHLMRFQNEFFRDYPHNETRMDRNHFLLLFGASFLGYLYDQAPEGKRVLLKEPDVRFLACFPQVFPQEYLLLLLRDGRDVVASTIRTWPDKKFSDVCQQWNDSAKLMLDFSSRNTGSPAYWLVKYEHVMSNTGDFVRAACDRYSLDPDVFPFDEIDDVPVIGSSTNSRKNGVVDWSIHKPRGDSFKPMGRWQSWSPREKSVFKKIAGETLLEADYCNDLSW